MADSNVNNTMDNTVNRAMPRSEESEMAVVGCMMLRADAILQASEILTKSDFYNKQYACMFQAMLDMYNAGEEIDEVTLLNRLKGTDLPPNVTTTEHINDIMAATPTSVQVKEYAKIVRDKSVLRKIITVNQDIENDCFAGKDSVEAILEKSEKEVFNLIKDKRVDDYVDISTIVFNALHKIEIASKTKGPVTGIPTGFTDLDYMTAGLQPSELIIVAASPSMGKTAFVLNIAHHNAIRHNLPTVIFSLEMSKELLTNRIFALESGVDAQKIRTGNLNDEEWMTLAEAGSVIGTSNLIIDDSPAVTNINNLKSKCRKYKMDKDIGLVIIDYLQLMEVSGRVESHQLAIAEISRALKLLAREIDVPVIALSQLSRAVQKREDKRPMMADLRDSGAIEQDADVVMFIHREDYQGRETDKKNIAQIIVAKQRNGPIGDVELAWIPELTKFANKERE